MSLSATITVKTVKASGFNLVRKAYDGTRVAVLKGTSRLAEVIAGDDAVQGASSEPIFDTAAVGAGNLLSVIGLVMEGTDAGNCVLSSITLAGEIEPKGLTVSGLSALGRVYDGTRVLAVSGIETVSGVLAGETVSLGGSPVGDLATANVGSGIAVVVSGLSLSGTHAGNYRVVAAQRHRRRALSGRTVDCFGRGLDSGTGYFRSGDRGNRHLYLDSTPR
ncbi:MAG: hypothetical protein EXS25_11260 [Pedosphaera sp.]|nr:hypothetical protein [Pedosphaera sp.]